MHTEEHTNHYAITPLDGWCLFRGAKETVEDTNLDDAYEHLEEFTGDSLERASESGDVYVTDGWKAPFTVKKQSSRSEGLGLAQVLPDTEEARAYMKRIDEATCSEEINGLSFEFVSSTMN